MALTPDGKHLIYRTIEGPSINVLDAATGKVVKRIERKHERIAGQAGPGAMSITPDSQFLIETSGDATVCVWGLASGKLLRTWTAPAGALEQLTLSPDGKKVASMSGNSIFLWEVATGRQLHASPGHQSPVTCLAFTPDGKRFDLARRQHHARLGC